MHWVDSETSHSSDGIFWREPIQITDADVVDQCCCCSQYYVCRFVKVQAKDILLSQQMADIQVLVSLLRSLLTVETIHSDKNDLSMNTIVTESNDLKSS